MSLSSTEGGNVFLVGVDTRGALATGYCVGDLIKMGVSLDNLAVLAVLVDSSFLDFEEMMGSVDLPDFAADSRFTLVDLADLEPWMTR